MLHGDCLPAAVATHESAGVACEVAYAVGYGKLPRPELPAILRTPRLLRPELAVAVEAVQPGSVPKVKPGLQVADGDEPRVTPAPTDTSARLARSEGAAKALSGQLSCAPALPVAARPEAVSGHAGLLAPPGTGPRGAGAAMSGSGGALWGSAPGGPGGGMGSKRGVRSWTGNRFDGRRRSQ